MEKKIVDKEKYLRWAEIKANRKHTYWDELPHGVQERLLLLKKIINMYDNKAEIRLIGSWVSGTWVDADTSVEILSLRKKITGKQGMSDIDIAVKSDQDINFEAIRKQLDFKVTFFKGILKQRFIKIP